MVICKIYVQNNKLQEITYDNKYAKNVNVINKLQNLSSKTTTCKKYSLQQFAKILY